MSIDRRRFLSVSAATFSSALLAACEANPKQASKLLALAEAIGAVYGAQDAFQSKILELIGAYEAECTRLSGSA